MRNTWLVLKREYLERVRTRSFLVLTLLLPAVMAVLMMVPAKLIQMANGAKHIVLVTSTPDFGETVRQQLLASGAAANDDEDDGSSQKPSPLEQKYVVDVDANPSEAERKLLLDKVSSHAIDSYVWLTDDAIAARKITWYSRETGLSETSWLREGLSRALLQQQLVKAGIEPAQTDKLFAPLRIESIHIEGGRESKGNGEAKIFEVVLMIMLLYIAVLLYGISVMRSVLEEKNSRIMEVLLSSATPNQLMTGKLLGVGAVGLTQILVWVILLVGFALPSIELQPTLSQYAVSAPVLFAFAIFFVLGYLLYSAMYAAIGAICTTEQEGQQLQFLVVIPLVLSVFMLTPIISTPDSPIAVWLSLVPFFAPLLMYARIVVQTPPLWQIALSLLLLVATIAGMLVLCARIYRVGVLIYGKRATLPEILKWLRYAKT